MCKICQVLPPFTSELKQSDKQDKDWHQGQQMLCWETSLLVKEWVNCASGPQLVSLLFYALSMVTELYVHSPCPTGKKYDAIFLPYIT